MSFIVKNTTLPGLFDLLAPHSCRGCGRLGAPLCNRCKNYILNEHKDFKADLPSSLPQTLVVGSRNGLMGKLIHDLKYQSVRALARPIAEILDQTLPTLGDKVVIVPLPTIGKHVRERGLDHTALIAKELAKIRHYQVQKILVRAKNTVQVGAGRQARLKQAETAYRLKEKVKINPEATYVLLDDVWTTGATMKAAIKKLKSAKPHKIAVVILATS